MKIPALKKLIKKEIKDGATFADILGNVLDVFNKIADKNAQTTMDVTGQSLIGDKQSEVAALTATACYKAEELGI